jgi:hypothetical protein
MNQMGFSELESAAKKKRTHRERFLGQIEAATPWALLVEQIEPFYPNGERGRLPIGLGWATARDECRLSARQQSLVRSRWLPAQGRDATAILVATPMLLRYPTVTTESEFGARGGVTDRITGPGRADV